MSSKRSSHLASKARTLLSASVVGVSETRRGLPRFLLRTVILSGIVICLLAATGCGKSQTEKALDSDANGYLCLACGEKFYTDREVFASHCPKCRKPEVDQVLGFVCPADKHVTVGPRGRGARACEKCRRGTTAVSIPREAELKAWGAVKKAGPEVGG